MQKLTRQQLADLISGIGSCYLSSGKFDGDTTLTALGVMVQALAQLIRCIPKETYEIPPIRD